MIISFEKGELVRHIGHLDLMRSMQRALRRSGLPIKYSKGFNPHIVMSFASPLSVGIWGKHELMDVSLEEEIPAGLFLTELNKNLPAALHAAQTWTVDDSYPPLMSKVAAASYDMAFEGDIAPLLDAMERYMAQTEILAIRKTKSGEKESNIRPMIFALSGEDRTISGTFSADSTSTLKPDVLVRSLASFAGVEAPHFIACRTCLYERQGEALVPFGKEN